MDNDVDDEGQGATDKDNDDNGDGAIDVDVDKDGDGDVATDDDGIDCSKGTVAWSLGQKDVLSFNGYWGKRSE